MKKLIPLLLLSLTWTSLAQPPDSLVRVVMNGFVANNVIAGSVTAVATKSDTRGRPRVDPDRSQTRQANGSRGDMPYSFLNTITPSSRSSEPPRRTSRIDRLHVTLDGLAGSYAD